MTRRVVLVAAIVVSVVSGVVTAEASSAAGATPIGNLYGRVRTELIGGWRYIVDPLQSGRVTDKGTRYPFPLDIKQQPGGTLVEFDWDQQASIVVSQDWNSQIEALEFYTGLVWYRRTFDFFPQDERRYFLYFEAANYHTTVYLNAEKMTRLADRLGLLVWSEVPVYWAIAYSNEHTRDVAVDMVTENVMRDRNRASVIVWSVANETPIHDERGAFLGAMIDRVRTLDPTRLVSAALDRTTKEGDTIIIDDPLGERLDLLAVNEYEGWYGSRSIDDITNLRWETPYEKPMIFSEFGAGALFGFHGPKHERWTEEYQQHFYHQTLKMTGSIPFLRGASPWILKDFRSPRRFHGLYQNFWNRKGLVSETGEKKLAFFVLRDWYATIKAAHSAGGS